MDSLRGSSVKIGTIQRRLAWPLRKDDTHKSRSVLIFLISYQICISTSYILSTTFFFCFKALPASRNWELSPRLATQGAARAGYPVLR